MTQVFISYSRRGTAFVEQLAADLKTAGLDVWYDLSRLEAGDTWPEEIQFAIDASDKFIIVISPNSIVSKWVRKEFLYASNKKKRIVPLLYKKCDLPLWLLDIHFIDIQDEKYIRNFGDILCALDMKPVRQRKPTHLRRLNLFHQNQGKKKVLQNPKVYTQDENGVRRT